MNKGTVAYDKEHDVLHIRYAPLTSTNDAMVQPGVIIKRETKHGKVNSIVILDFSKKETGKMANLCKGIDFIAIKKELVL